jgi:hypothetical protein
MAVDFGALISAESAAGDNGWRTTRMFCTDGNGFLLAAILARAVRAAPQHLPFPRAGMRLPHVCDAV